MSASIDRVLQDAVANGDVPHVAAIAANRDGIIYEGAAGPVLAGQSGDVTTGTQFRIMSMTKMVATTAALAQMETGALELDAPVDTYLPQFADLQVLEGFDGDTPKLRPAGSRATVKQLITHTSGLGYWFWNDQLVQYEKATGSPNVVTPPGTLDALNAPLVADPGTVFNYGINTDWLGRVVEVVAGTTLDVVVKDTITGPLGMTNTEFTMDDAKRANAVTVHVKGEDGQWVSAGPEVVPAAPAWWPGGHGLYSTPQDYIRFERALLRNGELDGERILKSDTVDAAFTNQIGAIDFPSEILTADPPISGSFRAGPGYKWGYGLLLNTQDVPGARRAYSGAWAGLFNTHFWVDRTTGICASIYTNSLPFITDEAMAMYGAFEQALYASM